MKTNQNEFNKIVLKAQAYDEFIARLNKLGTDRTYSVDEIKMELTLAFKGATTKYMDEIFRCVKKEMKPRKRKKK